MPNNMGLRESNEAAKQLAYKYTACLGSRNAYRVVMLAAKLLKKQLDNLKEKHGNK